MLLILVVSFICLSAAVPVSPHRRTPPAGGFHLASKSPYSSPTGFWVDSHFPNPNCQGSTDVSNMGTYGLCLVGKDASGKALSADVLLLEKMDSDFMYTSMLTFGAPFDCTGQPTAVLNGSTPMGCGEFNEDSWIMGYAPVSAEPWAAFTKGVVTKYFPEGTCGGSSVNWDSFALNTCLQHPESGGRMRYFKYTKCTEGSVSWENFSDSKCTISVSSETHSTAECLKDVDPYFGRVSYFSHACNL